MQVLLKERFNFGPNDYSNYFAFIGLVYGASQILSKYAVNSARDDPTRMVMACTLIMGLVMTHSGPTSQKLHTSGFYTMNRKPSICHRAQYIAKPRGSKQTSNPEPSTLNPGSWTLNPNP